MDHKFISLVFIKQDFLLVLNLVFLLRFDPTVVDHMFLSLNLFLHLSEFVLDFTQQFIVVLLNPGYFFHVALHENVKQVDKFVFS